MNTNMNRSYKEVTLDGQGFEKNYRNPLSKVFRYEYALYTLLCGWFLLSDLLDTSLDELVRTKEIDDGLIA